MTTPSTPSRQFSFDTKESKALKEVLADPSEHDRMAGRTRRAVWRLLGALFEVFRALLELLCALGSAVALRLSVALVHREEGGAAVFGAEAKALAVGKILSGFFSRIFGYRLALPVLGARKFSRKEGSGAAAAAVERVLAIAHRDYHEPPAVAAILGQRARTIRVCLSVSVRRSEADGKRRPVWTVSHYARHPELEKAKFLRISRSEHPDARMALISYFAQPKASLFERYWAGKDAGEGEGGEDTVVRYAS